MKAIKLASVFAVSAVAAAVSTTTFAAEPVVTGTAGLEYVTYGENANGSSLSGNKNGELNIVVDTGVVFAQLEFKTDGGDEKNDDNDEKVTIGLEKIYVTQGAVQFGRFDGSVSTGAFMGNDEIYGGVDLNTGQGTKGDTDDTGIRYHVTPELTVAIEATEAVSKASSATGKALDSQIGFAVSYVKDFGAFKAGVSGGKVEDAQSANIGAQTVVGPATLSLNYGVGKTGTDTTTDVKQLAASVAVAATDALTLTLQFNQDQEGDDKDSGTYFIGEYEAGDLTYYVKNYAGDLVGKAAERTIVGVKATF
ncbi:hypothetical protein C0J08_15345 [Marinomonas sp. CT5]|uniref:hypothetical protein n=1 Tax=Marinomonas sp. CT5 TaxID=2066133 RepID=UPI001BAEA2A1|nr:hypothetical protein [Marinomonas sp. CT5]QUX96684.1 hypothetical protein C0J08_15345 [Marinomonas sp. CT5]